MQSLVHASRLADSRYEVVLVASDKADAPGLGWAAKEGIATFSTSPKGRPKPEYEAEIDTALRAAGTEMIALAGYMRLLSPEFVGRWDERILNIHPSLLPKYKGLDTHARAIAAGDRVAGASVHVVTAELDDGPVIRQVEVPVLPDDDADTLAARVLTEEHRLYPAALDDFLRRHVQT